MKMKAQTVVFIGAYIGVFYAASLGMSFFSSYLLSKNNYNFRFPLFIASMYNLIHFALALLCILLAKRYKPLRMTMEATVPPLECEWAGSPLETSPKNILSGTPAPSTPASTPVQVSTPRKAPNRNVFRKVFDFFEEMGTFNQWVVLCSLAGSVDTAFSGYSLRKVPLAFFTMLKSSTPVFILFSRFLFRLEKPTFSLAFIIITIAFGIFLTSMNTSVECNSGDALMIIASSVMAGFRWAFVEYFIKNNMLKQNRSIIHSICILSLIMGVFLFIGFVAFEGVQDFLAFEGFATLESTLFSVFLILAGAFVTFFLCVSEYLLISKTSVITLSIAGIVKELMIVGISIQKGMVHLTTTNIGGLVLATIGICLFTFRSSIFPQTSPEQSTSAPKEAAEFETDETVTTDIDSSSSQHPVLTVA
ncbi:solute carrier family 35, member C2 [Nematocida displodere]|uniref:Solute carrier family 35, member C2 n=1 Tax=Nematocida displodere TaxID=1805483 RepID=A0A177EC53_9MICR|nr:solute carrier family 35, member C2 [Nematocida displodere]